MKPSSAKAKGRTCRRCKKTKEIPHGKKLCSTCRSQCSTCGVTLTEENQDKTTLKHRKSYRCKKCVATGCVKTRGNAGFNQREYDLKRNYGITLDQYDELLEQQDHSCAVCERHKSEFKINLAVDHDHKTGEIYGLLCNHCNRRLIGRIRDPDKFRNAADYLEEGTGLFVPDKPKKKRKVRKRK